MNIVSRFAKSGAYGAWLKSGDMTDYILLDCAYNNMAKLVKGPIVLLENH
jgi:hypothetical protein